MDAPVFLDKPQVIELHELQLAFFGGQSGIADEGLLDSAIVAPINYFNYTPIKNLFDLSACYAFHLSKNHPFIDGNKRIALASAITFLKINGIAVEIRQRTIFRATLQLTTSRINKFQFAEILKQCSPIEFSFMADFYTKKGSWVLNKGFKSLSSGSDSK